MKRFPCMLFNVWETKVAMAAAYVIALCVYTGELATFTFNHSADLIQNGR